MEDYCTIHLMKAKPVMTLMPLKAILEKLPPGEFKRIHRSYIIPLHKIKSLRNRKVTLASTELPVSNSYLASLAKWIKNK